MVGGGGGGGSNPEKQSKMPIFCQRMHRIDLNSYYTLNLNA